MGKGATPLERILASDQRLKEAVSQYEETANRTVDADATPPHPAADHWPVMAPEAYVGLVGEFVKTTEPFSEADPVGLLIHTLAGAACLIGNGPHFLVEHSPHYARINALFVGRTASARKGTAWSTPRYVLSQVDEQWAKTRVKSGLSSGE